MSGKNLLIAFRKTGRGGFAAAALSFIVMKTVKRSIVIALVCLMAWMPAFAVAAEGRIQALLAKMTLEEKLGQLNQEACWVNGMYEATDSSLRGEPQPAFLARVRRGEIGSILGATGLRNFNILQRAAKESRLGIPLIVGHDLVHGAYTTLPIPLAQSCAWDEELWRKGAELTAREGLLKGVNWTFAPMLDIARDPRWGRIAEGAGQDPHLAARYGVAMVRGLQGDDVSDGAHIAACLKHFIGYGASFGGRDYAAVEMSDSTLRDVYLPPFAAAIKAGALSVMPAFHTLNDVPCSVNRYLLKEILRNELKFDGMLISDFGAIGECRTGHGVAETKEEVAAMALKATLDQDMLSHAYANGLKNALEKGLVTMGDIDAAVSNVLRFKFRLGLFDHPFIDGAAASNRVDFAAHRAFAREAAAKSCVLLKNERETLPLAKNAKIALLGDIAGMDREMQGCWQLYWDNLDAPSLKAGLEARQANVSYVPCYSLTGACDRAAIRAAARDAEVVIAAFGEYSNAKQMAGENRTYTDIRLQASQREAIDEIRKLGKPFVAVLFNGRPLVIPELAKSADAILEAWHPGSSAGPALADLLFGEAEPYGRLTTEFPWTSGQTPLFYNYLATGRPNDPNNFWTTHYEDVPFEPIYPFGHGLAYTTFAYTNESVRVAGDRIILTCEVKNTGKRAGYEVVQAYVRDLVGEISRPVRELKGFQRIYVKPGETAKVTIVLSRQELAYHVNGKRILADGDCEAFLAPNARSGRKLKFRLPIWGRP